jgi:dipeptidyl aminopeptidase/acylaminoacyl peptidase
VGSITLPVDHKLDEKFPRVVLVYGGPERRDDWSYDPWTLWLADRGYAVLQINFSGSAGFGMRFIAAGFRQWNGTMRTDLLDGKRAVKKVSPIRTGFALWVAAMEAMQLWWHWLSLRLSSGAVSMCLDHRTCR